MSDDQYVTHSELPDLVKLIVTRVAELTDSTVSQTIREGFAPIHQKLDGLVKDMESGFANLDNRMDGIEQRLIRIETLVGVDKPRH